MSGVRRALEIASLPQHRFDARMSSGEFSKQQVRDARLLRSEIAGRATGTAKKHVRKTLGQVLAETFTKKEDPVETQVSKVERAHRWKAAFDKAVDGYVEKHGCSRATAVEKVSFSPAMREQHTLERFEKGLVLDSDVAKSGSV